MRNRLFDFKWLAVLLLIFMAAACTCFEQTGKQTQKENTTEPQSTEPQSTETQSMVKLKNRFPPNLMETLKKANLPPNCITCNSRAHYGKDLIPHSKAAAKHLMTSLKPYLKNLNEKENEELSKLLKNELKWILVRGTLIDANNNNFGATVLKDHFWTDENGTQHPLTVFRMAFTPQPGEEDSCYHNLMKYGNVKHVINLYDGEMQVEDLVQGEKSTAEKFGATYTRTSDCDYGQWRYDLRENPPDSPAYENAMKAVGRLIKEQILNPNNDKPKGNIIIHCGGGMHRTGMIFGVLQHTVNNTPLEEIKKTYQFHTDYKSQEDPGGFEQQNIDFIKNFKKEYIK